MSDGRQFKFQIEVVERLNDGKLSIEGRCCDGSIRIGDQFSTLYRQEWSRDEQGVPHVHLKFEASIEARVAAIRSIMPNLLESGFTGIIVIETTVPDLIQQNRMLEGCSSLE